MAAITWTDVTNIAPELSTISAGAQTDILALANTYLDATNWGGEASQKLRMGRIYLAAHFATLGSRKGKPGAVQSESAGGLSRSYANPMLTMNSTLQTTTYGQMYIMLARSTAARAGITVPPASGSDTGWDG